MCCCAYPNKNGESGYSWDGKAFGVHPVQPPTRVDADLLVFDEPGRCRPQVNGTGGIDYHSRHFQLVTNGNHYALLVRHGGGDERIELGGLHTRTADLLGLLESDGRYLMLHALHKVYKDGQNRAEQDTREHYVQAFIDGRLKKRKSPGRPFVRVWLEPKPDKVSR